METYFYKGKEMSIKELAELSGVSYAAMYVRLGKVKTVEEAVHPKNLHCINGEWLTIRQMAKIAGITYTSMLLRTYVEKDTPEILRPGKTHVKRTSEEKKAYNSAYWKNYQEKNRLKLKEYHHRWYIGNKKYQDKKDEAD